MSELVREALRHYQQKQEARVNTELIAALRAVQEDARRAGLSKLTKKEINAEITAYRQRSKKTKQPVR